MNSQSNIMRRINKSFYKNNDTGIKVLFIDVFLEKCFIVEPNFFKINTDYKHHYRSKISYTCGIVLTTKFIYYEKIHEVINQYDEDTLNYIDFKKITPDIIDSIKLKIKELDYFKLKKDLPLNNIKNKVNKI